MQTNLPADFLATAQGQEAEAILRQCVHCGLCNATCPTYQLLGDELDGPRGRIYLIKQILEGQAPTQKTQTHLDRCLTCRACETTCPSGVQYGNLLEIGREIVERKVGRSWTQNMLRRALRHGLSNPQFFKSALQWGRKLAPILPPKIQEKIPKMPSVTTWPGNTHVRKMLILEGCVQPSLAPNINAATARVLDRLQVQVIVAPKAACCGMLPLHLDDQEAAKEAARRNIDAWWPLLKPQTEQGAETILSNASACGVMLKDYAHLLKHDANYAEKAQHISAIARDVSELLTEFTPQIQAHIGGEIKQRISWHSPCTLQHGQQLSGKLESFLRELGVDLAHCADSHLCCGSAGTYSLLQTKIATQLRDQKITALEANQPALILSANIACQQHLQTGTATPIMHWIELIDQVMAGTPTKPVASQTCDVDLPEVRRKPKAKTNAAQKKTKKR